MTSLNLWNQYLPLTSQLPASVKSLVFFFFSKLELSFLFFCKNKSPEQYIHFPSPVPFPTSSCLGLLVQWNGQQRVWDLVVGPPHPWATTYLSLNVLIRKRLEASSFLPNNVKMNLTLKSFETQARSLRQNHNDKYIIFQTRTAILF